MKTFRNLPSCYDVFDIDGDGKDEVMGVQYYLAYKSNEHTPVRAYVTNHREPFYRWLYGDNVELGAVGKAPHQRRAGLPLRRQAGVGARGSLRDVPLYERDVRARARSSSSRTKVGVRQRPRVSS